MANYAIPKQRSGVTATAAGALYVDPQSVDIADASLALGALAVNDTIQIGVVPAGHVLVPHLSTLSVPVLDSNGTATGKVSIGTTADAASLLAATSVGSAISKGVGTLLAGAVGSATEDVPILATVTAAMATQATAGTITGQWVLRAYDPAIDG